MQTIFMGLNVTANAQKTVEIELLFDYGDECRTARRHANKVAAQFTQFDVEPAVEDRYNGRPTISITIDFNQDAREDRATALVRYEKVMHHMAWLRPDGETYNAPHGETLALGMLNLLRKWVDER